MARVRQRANRGLTMIELMVGLAIVAVLAALAAPSLRTFLMQQRLKSAAAELLADMQLARSTALATANVTSLVNVNFRSNANVSCYSLAVVTSQQTNCDCTRVADVCQFGGQGQGVAQPFRIVTIDASSGVTVAAPSQMLFTSSGMTTDRTARTLTVTAAPGGTLNVIIGQTGFPRLCSPAGTNISGISPCG